MITKKTNFIFIFADDLGYGDLGCYGNEAMLYDLSIDERQLENIAEKHPDICLKMSAQIDEWTTTLSQNTLRERLKT